MPNETKNDTHRYYAKQHHVRLTKGMETKTAIMADAISLIDGEVGLFSAGILNGVGLLKTTTILGVP